jgi:hypothetical protein
VAISSRTRPKDRATELEVLVNRVRNGEIWALLEMLREIGGVDTNPYPGMLLERDYSHECVECWACRRYNEAKRREGAELPAVVRLALGQPGEATTPDET